MIVKCLLKKGANFDAQTKVWFLIDILFFFFFFYGNIFISLKIIFIFFLKKNGWTSLHIATNYGNYEIVKLLLEKGANIHAQNKVVIFFFFFFFFFCLLFFLFLLFASNFLFPFLKDGWTPLHIALRYGKDEIARLLLENGANIHSTTKVLFLIFLFLFFFL